MSTEKIPEVLSTPSRYQIGDNAVFSKTETFEGITCRIIAVHFFPGKVKYDLVLYADGKQSRIYNVDSELVSNGVMCGLPGEQAAEHVFHTEA